MKREKAKNEILQDFFVSCRKVSKSKKSDIQKLIDYQYLISTFEGIINVIHDIDKMELKHQNKKRFGVEINDFEG